MLRVSSLSELLRWRASDQPDRCAFRFLANGEDDNGSLSYGELDLRARSIAAHLQQVTEPGQRALLLYPPSLEYIAGFFGCLYAGVVAVPAYPPSPRNIRRLRAIANNASVSLAITTTSILGGMMQMVTAATGLPSSRVLATDKLSYQPAAPSDDVMWPTETCFLQYTSGSTGEPKGIVGTHTRVLHHLDSACRRLEFSAADVGVSWQPLFHDGGLIGMVLYPLYAGFPMMLMSPASFLQHPVRWLRAISRYEATYSGAPTFGYDLCTRRIPPEECEPLNLKSWKIALIGAEPVRLEVIDQFAQKFGMWDFEREAFNPSYGLAEATLLVSSGSRMGKPVSARFQTTALRRNQALEITVADPGAQALVCCGSCLPDQRLVIVDPETSTACPEDEIGEIWVSGPGVGMSYWNRPEESQYTFRAHLAGEPETAFLRTSDLGFLHQGNLFVSGRLKDIIIIRGVNHYPQDIELTVQQSHPALSAGRGAAFSVSADTGEERLAIVHEVDQANSADVTGIFPAIRSAISERHELSIHSIVLVLPGAIPVTSSGKIERRTCRTRFLSQTLEGVAAWHETIGTSLEQHRSTSPEPGALKREAAEIEQWLVREVSKRLHSDDKIDIRQPFTSYGLDSVEAVILAGDLEQWLGRKFSPTLAWDYPNIAALASYLAGEPARPPHGYSLSLNQEDSIAVIGLGCRFPGAEGPDAFWELLHNGIDAITEVPPDRWNIDQYYAPEAGVPGRMNTRYGGFLEQVDQFDPLFFGISPREASRMDPQQRLLLEVSWEALEHAGLPPDKLAGTRTGVFVGISTFDYWRLLYQDPRHIDFYDGTGNALSVAANRLSYTFDFKGPSIAVDTACSSSLVAVHMACKSLLNGESDLALAGGVNIILSPELTIQMSQARMMSPSGRCHVFDESADGYVRGEGCGIVVLKRASEARADGDRVLAIVKGSAISQDGRSNGLTAPNGSAQQAVVRDAWQNARVSPTAVSFVEAHGSGTPLGDPIEFLALLEVLKEASGEETKVGECAIGSVKTNIGHLEAAAGIAGFIKVVLALNYKCIPPNLHLKKINPLIPIDGSPLRIPTRPLPWVPGERRLYAGISSFGLGGTNAHVVVEEAEVPGAGFQGTYERRFHILPLSARSERALDNLISTYEEHLSSNRNQALADICFTAGSGRSHFDCRVAIGASTIAELRQKLKNPLRKLRKPSEIPPRSVFLFPDEGFAHAGIDQELYKTEPAFRDAVDQCTAILSHLEGRPVSVFDDSADMLDRAASQRAAFVIEYALARLWLSWGVRPAAVFGCGVGEYVAACIAGMIGLEDNLRMVSKRGRLLSTLAPDGVMAAVFASTENVATEIAPYMEDVSIASINGPAHTVISGRRDRMEEILLHFSSRNIAFEMTSSSSTLHSPLVNPVRRALAEIATGVSFCAPRIPFISGGTGGVLRAGETPPDAYWRDPALASIRFASGLEASSRLGCNVLLEMGTAGSLLGSSRMSFPDGLTLRLGTWQKGESGSRALLDSLAQLYVLGQEVDWVGFHRGSPGRKVSLPFYPFERQRCWFDRPEPKPESFETRPASTSEKPKLHPLLGRKVL